MKNEKNKKVLFRMSDTTSNRFTLGFLQKKKVVIEPSLSNTEPPLITRQSRPTASSFIILDRDRWDSPLEFILACLGYAVGLGNIWRFPYLCYRNGGGAFLVPFILMLIFIGLPLFYLELYIGQYSGYGPIKAFSYIAPFFGGIGYCTSIIILLVSIYYMIIVAWTLFYTFVSITGNLGWGSCENKYNSEFCYSGFYDSKCRTNNTGSSSDLTFYMKQCMSIGDICTLSGMAPYNAVSCKSPDGKTVPWYKNITRVLASEEYFNHHVLGRGDATWEHWGEIQWHLVACLFISWLIAFGCVIKGIKSAGKVVYFTALFPYVMLTVLLVRGVTLEGADEGIYFYISPEWETLRNAKVWGDAASQIFYSFGLGCGSLVTLASYNNFYNNCHFDAVVVSIANLFTSIYAGIAIFSVLGFQAQLMGVSIEVVAESGPGLAFVAYPEAILQMPLPQFWSVLFFFMLFILGMGSQFAGIEAIATAVMDQWPQYRRSYWKITGFTCLFCFLLGLPMCFSGGVYLFTLLDWNTASWAILVIGFLECVSVSWSYGINRTMNDLAIMHMKFNKFNQFIWKLLFTFITPFCCIGVLVFIMIHWENPSHGAYKFPPMADALGWAVGGSTLICFPLSLLWLYHKGVRGKNWFHPTLNWKPAVTQNVMMPRSRNNENLPLNNDNVNNNDNDDEDIL